MSVDHTHDPGLQSWVAGANGHAEFPIQNLPLGVFSPLAGAPRGGIAIGDSILDLRALHEAALLDDEAQPAVAACAGPALNGFLALGAGPRRALRDAVSALLQEGSDERPHLLHKAEDCMMYVPATIGDYTDFYAGIHHVRAMGRLFRGDASIAANYHSMPIGYHGRASSVGLAGEARRPNGQRLTDGQSVSSFGPSERLDFELELGLWVGPGNALGVGVPIGQAHEHIAGYCLLNDWSARDIQAWEAHPLGPFLGKSFCTSVSPWIVTPEALAPFRARQMPRTEGGRPPPHLFDAEDQERGALAVEIEALLLTPGMRRQKLGPHRLSRVSSLDLYWTPAQLLTHQTSNGCNLRSGDLLGTGTISSSTTDGCGSMMEITEGGRSPITLPSGEERRFLEDGDEVTLRARATREGAAPIGFGSCRGVVTSAVAAA